jgi:hypothetical protein
MTGVESIPLAYYGLLGSGLFIATIFVFTRLLAGDGPALLSAVIVALLPANLEMLSWSGYSNIFALALVPIAGWALLKLRTSLSAAPVDQSVFLPPVRERSLRRSPASGGGVVLTTISLVVLLWRCPISGRHLPHRWRSGPWPSTLLALFV